MGRSRLIQEILVRENEGVIEAEIFPDYEYVKKQESPISVPRFRRRSTTIIRKLQLIRRFTV